VSGIAGWIMLAAIVLAIPDLGAAPSLGTGLFFETVKSVVPEISGLLFAAIGVAQYFCGLATVTSASRMAYAFARDGGLPASMWVRRVCPRFRTPDIAIWTVASASVLFTLYTPVYSTITAVCTILLYVSYVLPTAIGWVTFGRSWTRMGPWQLGKWFRPLAAASVLGCCGLIVIGMQPPNEKAAWVVLGTAGMLAVIWFFVARHSFRGPPCDLKTFQSEGQSGEGSNR
jgi:amino acid transporter